MSDEPMSDQPRRDPAVAKQSTLAVVAFVFSISGICLGPFGSLPGIICGHIALRHIRQDSELGGKGLAVAAMTIGYIFLVLFAVGFCYVFLLTPK